MYCQRKVIKQINQSLIMLICPNDNKQRRCIVLKGSYIANRIMMNIQGIVIDRCHGSMKLTMTDVYNNSFSAFRI